MSDRLPQVELDTSALGEAEPWPEWREPPIEVTDALRQTQSNPYASAPEASGPYGTETNTALEAKKPKKPRSSDSGDNLRAVGAQLSVLVPFIGPMIAFGMSPARSAARRSAAKAFNGQALAALSVVGVTGVATMAASVSPGATEMVAILGTIGVIGGWLLQVLIAVIAAATGHDWTSPLTTILRLRILPDDDTD